MTPLQHALTALADLRERYGWLEDSVENGTARAYRPPHLSVEQRAAADAAARQERHERSDVAFGESPDLFRFDVMELRDTILTTADAMCSAVAGEAKVEQMPDASFGDHAGMWLVYAAKHLPTAAQTDPQLVVHVQRKCEQLITQADSLLGNITEGQTLDAVCFVCDGKDDHHPVGGGHTLRYRVQHADRHPPKLPCTVDCRPLIVCESGRCQPTPEQCGYEHRGHPAWDLRTEDEWFGDRIGVVKHYCSECSTRVYGTPMTDSDGVLFCGRDCRRRAKDRARQQKFREGKAA